MKRSCSDEPQRGSGPPTGDRHSRARMARTSSCCARLMRGVRRHLEAAELDEPQPAGRAVGRIELVDADLGAVGVAGDVGQDVAHQPVDEPGRRRGAVARLRDLGERDLELVQAVVARLVDPRRLAGRADEQPRKQVAEARPPEPVGDEAFEQVRPAQERAVERRRPADHDMIAAAGARVLAVDHELVGAEPRLARLFVERLRVGHAFAPAQRRMDVDLDDARVGRDADHIEARVDRRRVALDVQRQPEALRRRLDRGDQLQIVLEPLDRRHEHVEAPVARLDRDGGAHRAADVAERLFDPLLSRLARLGRGEGRDRLGAALRLLESGQRLARGGRIGRNDIGERRRGHVRQAPRAAGDSRPDCRPAQDRGRPGASSISRCANDVRSPGPASAGSAARIRKAR